MEATPDDILFMFLWRRYCSILFHSLPELFYHYCSRSDLGDKGLGGRGWGAVPHIELQALSHLQSSQHVMENVVLELDRVEQKSPL